MAAIVTRTSVVNPYDHANPITDERLFAGRREELREAEYYLAVGLTQKPINLAVIGDRAAGKTSFLNMVDQKARDHGYLVARVDLNNDSVATDLTFFLELYESILAASVEAGLFGGMSGQIYQTYRDTVDTLEAPERKEFALFLFALQYANRVRGHNLNAPIPQHMVLHDLGVILKEAEARDIQRIAILFDECDLLTKNEALLQKLRNLFSHLSGYLLVFTGTPKMFPAMDAVFSPVSRQFKKVPIGPFADFDETIQCIRQPLEKAQQEKIVSMQTISEIHDLTQGNPYEIRLICHCMYRRFQERGGDEMTLTVETLDEVIIEMERLQGDRRRQLIRAFQRLGEKDLAILRDIGLFHDGLTLEDAVLLHGFLKAGAKEDEAALKEEWRTRLEEFQKAGIVTLEPDGRITFTGEDFDRLYLRYYASRKNVKLYWETRPLERILVAKLWRELQRRTEGVDPINPQWHRIPVNILKQGDFYRDVFGTIENGLRPVANMNESTTDAVATYLLLKGWRYRGHQRIPLIKTDWLLEGDRSASLFVGPKLVDEELSDVAARIQEVIEAIKEETSNAGIRFVGWDVLWEPVTDVEAAVEAGLLVSQERARDFLIGTAGDDLILWYREGSVEKAMWAGEMMVRIDSDHYLSNNNLGYLRLRGGDVGGAKELLAKARAVAKDEKKAALSLFNLGIIDALEGHLDEAKGKFGSLVALFAGRKDDNMACLLTLPGVEPLASEGLREIMDARISDAARLNLAALAIRSGDRDGAAEMLDSVAIGGNANVDAAVVKLRREGSGG